MAGGHSAPEPMDAESVMPHAPASADATRHSFRLWERGLPALGVAVGILLVAGPVLPTLIRRLLSLAPGRGGTVSLHKFPSLLGAGRFHGAALKPPGCGARGDVAS